MQFELVAPGDGSMSSFRLAGIALFDNVTHCVNERVPLIQQLISKSPGLRHNFERGLLLESLGPKDYTKQDPVLGNRLSKTLPAVCV